MKWRLNVEKDKRSIKYIVEKAVSAQFDLYSLANIIDDIMELSTREKDWAKEHLTWQIIEED